MSFWPAGSSSKVSGCSVNRGSSSRISIARRAPIRPDARPGERHDLGYRDQQADRRHELRDRRRGAQVPEEEALEDEPEQRRDDDDRHDERREEVPLVLLAQRVEQRCREERLGGEREVEDARRLVGEDEADRYEPEDAPERDAADEIAEELRHDGMLPRPSTPRTPAGPKRSSTCGVMRCSSLLRPLLRVPGPSGAQYDVIVRPVSARGTAVSRRPLPRPPGASVKGGAWHVRDARVRNCALDAPSRRPVRSCGPIPS
jgi:hypothetical protein